MTILILRNLFFTTIVARILQDQRLTKNQRLTKERLNTPAEELWLTRERLTPTKDFLARRMF